MPGKIILLIGYGLIVEQAIAAHWDRYFNQRQLRSRGVRNGYSLLQHGGYWSDILLVTPLIAHLVDKYRFAYTSWYSILIFIAAAAFTLIAGHIYNKVGNAIPVPYAHDGNTPLAGWIHGIFAVAALWIMVMFYFTPLKPLVSTHDLILVSCVLAPFFFLGVYDFSRKWIFYPAAKKQVAIEIATVWIVTAIRLKWHLGIQ